MVDDEQDSVVDEQALSDWRAGEETVSEKSDGFRALADGAKPAADLDEAVAFGRRLDVLRGVSEAIVSTTDITHLSHSVLELLVQRLRVR